MSAKTALVLTLISLAFVAAGFLILIQGEAGDRAMAIACIAFFGACALIGAFSLAPKRALKVEADGAVVLMPDSAQSLGFILGGAGLSLGCFLLAPLALADGNLLVAAIAWFGAAFFALAVPIGAWRLLQSRPLARLNEAGVQTFGLNAWSLSWQQVRDIGVYEIHNQRFVAFDVDAEAPTFSDRVSDAFNLPRYALGVAGTAARFEDLEAQVRALWSQNGPPPIYCAAPLILRR